MRTECIACGKHLYTINYDELVCLNIKCERYDKSLIRHDSSLCSDEDNNLYYEPDSDETFLED